MHGWPTHLAWVRHPEDGPRYELGNHDDDVTGIYPWPAGVAMASELITICDLRDKTVCDLGCGRGMLGFSAMALGAQSVTFLDASPVICDVLTRAIAATAHTVPATVLRYKWGDVCACGPFDFVLGGDILYRAGLFQQLAQSIAALLAPTGHCLLSDPRNTIEATFAPAMSAAKLVFTHERRNSYTLYRFQLAAS